MLLRLFSELGTNLVRRWYGDGTEMLREIKCFISKLKYSYLLINFMFLLFVI